MSSYEFCSNWKTTIHRFIHEIEYENITFKAALGKNIGEISQVISHSRAQLKEL